MRKISQALISAAEDACYAVGCTSSTSMAATRSIIRFSVVQALLVMVLAVLLTRLVWTVAPASDAVWGSAWLAIGVQTVTFAIAKLAARENVIAGWGLGVLLRFATLGAWAFLGIKALAYPTGPALVSLALFFFVSTLIEPLFLNG